MAILTIRKHQRFALCHEVNVTSDGAKPRAGLLVEVSLEGCRLTLPGSQTLRIDQSITVGIAGFGRVSAVVRWLGNGIVGLRFERALHHGELLGLIGTCRPKSASDTQLRAYGT